MLIDSMQIFYCFTSRGLQLDCFHYIAFQTFLQIMTCYCISYDVICQCKFLFPNLLFDFSRNLMMVMMMKLTIMIMKS